MKSSKIIIDFNLSTNQRTVTYYYTEAELIKSIKMLVYNINITSSCLFKENAPQWNANIKTVFLQIR